MNSRLKQLRKTLKLTQQEFSDSINMSRSNLGSIESGIINLTDRNINIICEKHNVNKDWLLTGNSKMFIELTEDDELSILIGEFLAENDEYKKKIIKTMLSLPDEDWFLIKRLIEKFN